jgi:hypothetical protein
VTTLRVDRLRLPSAPVTVLGVAVLLEVAYVLLFSPFVTDDAALHIGSAAALNDSIVGGLEVADGYLEWNPWPAPSVLANLLLAALLPVVGIDWAERLVILVYVCALPAAALYAVRAMQPGWAWLACFALPLTFSFTFISGFFNFSYSVVAFLLTAGFVLRSPVRPTTRRTAGLSALLLLTFFCHLVGYGAAIILVVLVLTIRGLFRAELRGLLARHGLAAVAPSGLLAAAYLVTSKSAEPSTFASPLRTLAGLVTLEWGIVTFDHVEVVFCLAAALALGLLLLAAALRQRPWHERNPDTLAVGVFTLVITLVAVLAPDSVGSGGSLISQRLVLFPALGAVLWLAGQRLSSTQVRAAACVALASAAGLAIVRYDDFRQLERVAQDLEPLIPCVEHDSTIVHGNLAPLFVGSLVRNSFLDLETGRVSAPTNGFDLGSLDLGVPQWLQRYRPATSPLEHLVASGAYIDESPPPFDFAAFERATGKRPDYVILSGRPAMTRETLESDTWRRFDPSLRERYRLVSRSPERWWELWVTSENAPRPGATGACPV